MADLERMAREADGLEEAKDDGGGGTGSEQPFDPTTVKQPRPIDFDAVLLWNPTDMYSMKGKEEDEEGQGGGAGEADK